MSTPARILSVDEEEVARRSFVRVLAGEHCKVEAASSWSEVAQLMQRQPFDVVLLDLRMPGTDGMTILRSLKQCWPESEVIVITGYPTLETAKEAVALGAYDYLMKPVGPQQVSPLEPPVINVFRPVQQIVDKTGPLVHIPGSQELPDFCRGGQRPSSSRRWCSRSAPSPVSWVGRSE